MKAELDTTVEDTDTRDISLPGGCILCGGDLDVRLSAGSAASVCTRCHWISRPHMKREDGAVHVIHPAGLLA
ncbi:hypothetical protein [Anaeromyxobacter oryzae]|uniref:DksA C4-type domain-containing protein n=1 Tax=Anaeromyxobacter oryzae TaxID=2918170 RepID=A0ABN6MSJ0_9BACT|nr:hypothetical protein [Anaeromyxobacter oryzae]BDG03953.1 hypothetical protein AMOR_29490 [Anaeromyxobacter oryzae]